MIAHDESSDEEGDGSEDADGLAKRLKSMSGDDLGDSFSIGEDRNAKLGWIQEMLRRENEDDIENADATTDDSEGDEDEDEDEEEGSGECNDGLDTKNALKDWEQSDEDELDTDLEEDEGEDDDQVKTKDKKEYKKQEMQTKSSDMKNIEPNDNKYSSKPGDLPYTIEAPTSLEEFTSLVGECSDDEIVEAIKRIRTFNAISIAAENRKKMQVRNSFNPYFLH